MKTVKGYSFKLGNQQIILKDVFSNHQPSFDLIYFSTNIEGQLCKIFQLQNEVSELKFQKERSLLEQISSLEFVTYVGTHEFVHKKHRYGIIIFQRIKKASLLIDDMDNVKEKDLIIISKSILKILNILHSKNLCLLSLNPDVLTFSINEVSIIPIDYSIILQNSMDHKGINKSLIYRHFFDTNFKYKSPQFLNTFSRDPIDFKSDIFVFGCLIFELAYKTYPFQSELGVFNLNIPNLNDQKYNNKLVNKIVSMCLVQYSKRPTTVQLLSLFDEQQQIHNGFPLSIQNKQNKKTFFDQVKNTFALINKQSQKWIFNYIQPNGRSPDDDMIIQLLNKVYKNNNKLIKIYNLIQKYTNQNIKSVQSISKVLLLLWNFIRKGPQAILNDYPQNISTIIKITQKLKSDNLIQQLNIILSLKVTITDQFKHIFHGNFGLIKLQSIFEINSNTIVVLIEYLKNIIQIYKRIINCPSYISNIFFDEIYDLCCSLVLLYLSIKKDIEQQRRKPEDKLNIIEKELDYILNNISKLPKAQLHLVASLDTLENYKHFFDFQAMENVRVSVFELFYKTELVYHNLRLPCSYRSINKAQEVVLDDDQDQQFQIKEVRNEKHVQGLITSRKQKEVTAVFNLQQKNKSKVDDFQVSWGLKKNVQVKADGFDNVFGNKLAKSTFIQLDFPIKMNVPQPKKQIKQKNIFQDFTIPKPKQKNVFQNFLQIQKPVQVIKPKQTKITNDDFFNFDFPTKKVDEKQIQKPVVDFNFLNPAQLGSGVQITKSMQKIVQQPNTLFLLSEQLISSLKDQNLKELVRKANIIIEFNAIKLNKVIGCGNAGEVYEGTLNNKTVAIKKIKSKQQNPNAHKQFQRQITTLIMIGKNTRLNSLIGLSKQNSDYYLLMDYCAGGNLFELLHRRLDLVIPWKVRISIAKQIAEGMNYLHSRCRIIHRDLKSLNVLIGDKYKTGQQVPDNIVAKITDFGLARKPDQFMTNALGTLHWMAPQLLQGKQYDYKVDTYSFGIVLWEICSRQTPYQKIKSPPLIIKHVALNGGRPDMKALNPGCPQELKQLMTKCWSANSAFRPSFQLIIQALNKIES